MSIANGIAQAIGGILLIDEVETSIHSKYYSDIFQFIIKACQQFKVQLFLTTHSIEAIDTLLKTQNYENNDKDLINVITFKKEDDKTMVRVLKGKEVYSHRNDFDFEVRL